MENVGYPVLKPYEFLPARDPNPKGPYKGQPAPQPKTKWKDLYTPFRGKDDQEEFEYIGSPNPKGPPKKQPAPQPKTKWKDLYTPFHGKEDRDIENIGFPVLKPYQFLSPRSSTPLGPYKGGPPPEPTWWQKVWPIVGKESAEMRQWYMS